MQNLNLKKSQYLPANKPPGRRINLRALARRVGIPEFMLRFAQKRRVTIPRDEVAPKYRHD